MKQLLSELIIEGAKLRPQGYGFYFPKVAGVRCSCAMGAFAEAIGGVRFDGDISYRLIDKTYSHAFGQIPFETVERVTSWNDKLKLTREQIAQRLIDEKLDVIIDY